MTARSLQVGGCSGLVSLHSFLFSRSNPQWAHKWAGKNVSDIKSCRASSTTIAVLVHLMSPRCTRPAAGPLDPSLSGLTLTQHVLERYGLAKLMVQVGATVTTNDRRSLRPYEWPKSKTPFVYTRSAAPLARRARDTAATNGAHQ